MSESDLFAWEEIYRKNPVDQLPWNAGGPDPDLVRLVESGKIPLGQALDVGTGPGHDAVYLIHKGFNVVAIDLSPTAVIRARENASNAGLFGFFQQGDIRTIPMEDAYADFVNDRGCFHVLNEADRPKAASELARVLRKKGLFLLKVFSDKEPWGDGPHRFSRKELDDLFLSKFRILEFWEGQFKAPAAPRSPLFYGLLMEKK